MTKRWTYKKLEECSYVQNGFAFNSKLFNSNKNGTPLVRIRDIKRGFSNTYTTESCEKEYNVENGDLLIGMDGDFNVCIWNGGFSYLNQRVCHVVTSNEILSRFLYYYLPFPLNKINEKTSYSTVKHLSSKQIYNIITPVPPLSEQQAIVSRLESAFAKIDAVKANAEREIQEAKSLFQKALSEAMMPKEGWEEKKVGEIFKTYAGGTPIKTHKAYYEGGDVPWIRSGEVCCKYITECEMFITEEGMNNSSAKYYPENTVLVAMYGATAAQVGILKFEATSNQAVCGILPHKDFVPEYVYYWFSNIQEELAAQAQGGAQPNISQIKIKNVVIPYAPLSEQQAIVTHLDTLSEKLRAVEEKQKAIMAECDAMKQALLREVFE